MTVPLFGARLSGASQGSGLWHLIERRVITTASTTETFSSLDGDADVAYKMLFRFVNDSAGFCEYSVRPNGLTTNQKDTKFQVNEDTTFSAASGTTLRIQRLITGGIGMGEANIAAASGQDRLICCQACERLAADAASIELYSGVWADDSTNITSLVIAGDQTDGIGVDTEMSLYKQVF